MTAVGVICGLINKTAVVLTSLPKEKFGVINYIIYAAITFFSLFIQHENILNVQKVGLKLTEFFCFLLSRNFFYIIIKKKYLSPLQRDYYLVLKAAF